MKYEPALDGLRACAIGFVMLYHVIGWREFVGGWIGVDIFFVLSGFLITTILSREITRTGTLQLGTFYARRVLRLVPALILVLACVMVIAPLVESDFSAIWRSVAISGVYMMNWNRAFGWGPEDFLGHTWSLATEEQFYLLWPLILLVLRKRNIAAWLAVALALEIGWRCFLVGSGASMMRTYNGFDTHSDTLLMGCLLAVIPLPAGLIRALQRCAVVPILGLVGIAAVVVLESRIAQTLAFPVVGLLSCWMIVLALHDGWVKRILSLSVLTYAGRISYGLYLWHYPLLMVIRPMMPRHESLLLLVTTFAVSFALASLSYVAVERPFLRMKAYFPSRVPIPAVAVLKP